MSAAPVALALLLAAAPASPPSPSPCPQWREDPTLLARLEEELARHVDAARSGA